MSFSWQRNEIMYCGNVHSCSTVEGMINQIKSHVLPIKAERKISTMYLGVWINQPLLDDFKTEKQKAKKLIKLMEEHSLVIKTLNAFPQNEFHATVVKEQVYFPEWCDDARMEYTLNLARFITVNSSVFAQNISISTVPLGYKKSWTEDKHKCAIQRIHKVAVRLADILAEYQIDIRLCFEMEPDCTLETSEQLVEFFIADLQYNQIPSVSQHIGVCFDICHQAVMFEEVNSNFNLFKANQIKVGKIQVSNALKFLSKDYSYIEPILSRYFTSPYLHQTKILSTDGIISIADIDETLAEELLQGEEARVHFHVPINKCSISQFLQTTQSEILSVFSSLDLLLIKPDIEVETYTWHIIDEKADKNKLNEYIIEEIKWLEQAMQENHLIRDEYAE